MVLQGEGLALNKIAIVFVDDGGVLNDNERRAQQWRRLLAEYFVPRLGGTADAWANANVGALERSWTRFLAEMDRAGSDGGVHEWTLAERRRWLIDMFEQVGVEGPADLDRVTLEVTRFVNERIRAAIPGAAEAVRAIHERGLTLHGASGALSWELDPILRGAGVRDHFDRLYGPDLVDRYKNGPHFYEAILADSRADPRAAVVVEDNPRVRDWAASCGMRTFASLADLRAALA